MKRISIKNYRGYMGTLIDVQDKVSYNESHYSGSINIPLNTLLIHYKELLSKNTPYYIVCRKGHNSQKAVSILEYYGYNVTQVYNEWKKF